MKVGDLVRHKQMGKWIALILKPSRNGLSDCWCVLRGDMLHNWFKEDMEVISESR